MRLLPGVRTVIRRRGLGYLSSVVRDHLPPRVAYQLLRAPGDTSAMLRLVRRAWMAFDDVAATSSAAEITRAIGQVALEHPVLVADGVHVTPAHFVGERSRELDRLLNALHRAGLTGLRHSLDHLVIGPQGHLAFTAMHKLRAGPARGIRFMTARDLDREAANARFGLSLLTEAGVRNAQLDLRNRLPEGWFRDYAPIDFGGGVSMGMFLSTDSGTGRWEFLNRHVVAPLVRDRRVLDLGSNNGSQPLMMARAGAREVVAVEQSPLLAEAARLNHAIFEWRDMHEHPLHVRLGDMRDFLAADWGPFDVITAFCSLYYLPASDMSAIVRKAAGLGATFILQANEGADNIPAARASALHDLLTGNGYSSVTVHTRDAFTRPLLVGAPAGASAASSA